MIIPWQQIEQDTLMNLVSEFVSRNGTDNGYDLSLEKRIQQVVQQLKVGEAVIVFDAETESVNIVPKAEASAFGH
ncbi:hypothetical protein EOPP23_05545 [Endozoicomonas sp. OPT23]|uniref:YheU family protein n=1 Tax=Endozoicomonas sp. OPT23 TaxID=2072845 RepID=UPI00129A141F|nr:YheU family protein [Endozoicomonas sp. OPT23]MRI32448.1 hypothetical protein [Endozoicomonas sp. OPT23]